MKIRFCDNNQWKSKVYRRLCDEFPNQDIKIKDCVKQCSVCREMPMATINNTRITAKDGDVLYRKIVDIIHADPTATSSKTS